MLNLCRIQALASANSAQELLSALLWQRQFSQFNGERILADLAQHPDLWASFLFTCPAYTPDKTGLSLKNTVRMLVELASSNIYQADTLYLLAPQSDSILARLLELGKKWQADSVEVIDRNYPRGDRKLQQQLAKRLSGAIRIQGIQPNLHQNQSDGIVLCKRVGSLILSSSNFS